MQHLKEKLTIKSWAEDDKPREKLQAMGQKALSDAELIAILIGSGNRHESAVELSRHILKSTNYNLNKLGKMSMQELMRFNGIGEAKANSIMAAFELGRRRKESDTEKQEKIARSKDAYSLLYPHLADIQHEEFWILLLNRSNRVIRKECLSSGGLHGTVVDIRIMFRTALEHLACSIIVAHNHPSGNCQPSNEDIRLTQKLKEAGKVMDISLLDHLIITDQSYYSFGDEGTL